MQMSIAWRILFLILFLAAPVPSSAETGTQAVDPGRIPLYEKEQTAVAAAMSGTIVTRHLKSVSVEATPRQADPFGCVPVEVVTVSPVWKEINHYRICSGLITAGEYAPEEPKNTGTIDDFVLEIARKASKHGMAQGIFQGSTVKASALRRETSCSVEVQIFQKGSLVSKTELPCEVILKK